MPMTKCIEGFHERFGHPPEFVVNAPGRVNLIGDHTDYNNGLVLPMAINRSLLVAGRATSEDSITIHSAHYDETLTLDITETPASTKSSWAPYASGVVAMLIRQRVKIRGVELWVGGDLTPGAGLASSAALAIGVARALLRTANAKLSPVALATLCRRAEHEFAHAPCGIMDQLCCTLARPGHALMIDCKTMMPSHIELQLKGFSVLVIDTGVRHSIADREYRDRRRECATALALINETNPRITSLRTVTEDDLDRCTAPLDETLKKRVRHVVTENIRVLQAAEALATGDLRTVGRLMDESHVSLRDDFAVSCVELDYIAETAWTHDGVLGARMTGGGFGGCIVALVSPAAIGSLVATIKRNLPWQPPSGAGVVAYAVTPSGAVSVEELGERDAARA